MGGLFIYGPFLWTGSGAGLLSENSVRATRSARCMSKWV